MCPTPTPNDFKKIVVEENPLDFISDKTLSTVNVKGNHEQLPGDEKSAEAKVSAQHHNQRVASKLEVERSFARPPTKELAEKKWRQWRVRRKANNAIRELDFVALTFGLDPKKISQLSAKTFPTLDSYNERREIIREIVAVHTELRRIGDDTNAARTQVEDLINFSKIMALTNENNWPIAKELFELNEKFCEREKQVIQVDATLNNASLAIKEIKPPLNKNTGNKKFENLEITLGGLLFVIQKMAIEGGTIPPSLIWGTRLNVKNLAEKVTEAIEIHLSDSSAKPGHSAEAVRKAVASALAKFPENDAKKKFGDGTETK